MTCNRGEVRLTVLLLEINVVLWFCGVVKLRSCVDLLCIDRIISTRQICELYDSDRVWRTRIVFKVETSWDMLV